MSTTIFPEDQVWNLSSFPGSVLAHLDTPWCRLRNIPTQPLPSWFQGYVFTYPEGLYLLLQIFPLPTLPLHPPLTHTTWDISICFSLPKFVCIYMAMLTLVPLAEWPSLSLPPWYTCLTNIHSVFNAFWRTYLTDYPSLSPPRGVYSVPGQNSTREPIAHRCAASLTCLAHLSPSLTSLWAAWVLRRSSACLCLRAVSWMNERISPWRLPFAWTTMYFWVYTGICHELNQN